MARRPDVRFLAPRETVQLSTQDVSVSGSIQARKAGLTKDRDEVPEGGERDQSRQHPSASGLAEDLEFGVISCGSR